MRKDYLKGVYSGTEASVLLLKGKLDMIGVSSVINKDSKAGTWGSVAENIDLYIEPGDLKDAEPVIHEFMHNEKVEKF